MNATKNLLTNLCNLLVCACEAFRYGLTFLRAILCSRAVLAAKLLAVESQLAACKQRIDSKKRRRPRFTASRRCQLSYGASQPLMNVGVVGLQEPQISVTLYKSKTYLLSATTFEPNTAHHISTDHSKMAGSYAPSTRLRCGNGEKQKDLNFQDRLGIYSGTEPGVDSPMQAQCTPWKAYVQGNNQARFRISVLKT